MHRYGQIVVILLILGGCKSADTSLPYPLTVSAEGIGPIHMGESFDISMMRGKLPGFNLEKLSEVTSANAQTIVQLKHHDDPIALVISDPTGKTVREIVVLSPLVKNTRGIGVNDPLKRSGRLRCIKDICQDNDTPSMTYRINQETQTIREITVQQL